MPKQTIPQLPWVNTVPASDRMEETNQFSRKWRSLLLGRDAGQEILDTLGEMIEKGYVREAHGFLIMTEKGVYREMQRRKLDKSQKTIDKIVAEANKVLVENDNKFTAKKKRKR